MCFNIIRCEEIEGLESIAQDKREKFVSFLTQVCTLLIETEAHRSKSALITSAMFFELVIAGEYKLSDITKLPLSIKGAMSGVRVFDELFSGNILNYKKYDNSDEVACAEEKVVTEILCRNLKITRDWLALKGIMIPEEAIDGDYLRIATDVLTDAISSWYSIKVKSPPVTDEDMEIRNLDLTVSSNADESMYSSWGDLESALGISPLDWGAELS